MENNTQNTENKEVRQLQLTTTDIKSLLNIIDVASQRGAFKTTEYVDIGTLYQHVSEFITQADYHDRQEKARKQAETKTNEVKKK